MVNAVRCLERRVHHGGAASRRIATEAHLLIHSGRRLLHGQCPTGLQSSHQNAVGTTPFPALPAAEGRSGVHGELAARRGGKARS